MEKVCYVCGTLGARGQCYSKNLEWRSKFRDLVPLLTSGGLPLGKKTFYSGKRIEYYCFMIIRVGQLKRKM